MSFMEKPFEALVTSARTTGQTVLDKDGKLKMALHNLVPNTDLSDEGDWTHSRLASLVAAGISPSGKVAYLTTEDTATGSHGFFDGITVTAGNTYTVVFDIKSNGITKMQFTNTGTYLKMGTWLFDLVAVTATQISVGVNASVSITLISDGYYRCVVTADATASGTDNLQLYHHNGSTTSYTGDGVSGVYLSRPRVYQSAVHAPAELVTNGDFAADTDWTKGTGWTIAAGVATHAAGSGSDLTQNMGLVAGKTYVISFDVPSITVQTGLSVAGAVPNYAVIVGSPVAGNSYSFVFVASGAAAGVRCGSAGDLEIDNITIVQVLDDGMQLATDGTDFLETTNGPVYHLGRAYDANGAVLGSQHFEGRTNGLTHMNDITHADWSKSAGGTGSIPVVTANSGVSPDGTVNADLVTFDVDAGETGSDHSLIIQTTNKVANTNHAGFIWLRGAAGGEELVFRHAGNTDFTLLTLTTSWVRYGSIEGASSGGTSTGYTLGIRQSISGLGVINATASVYVYNAQLEEGSFATPDIPTLASAVSRGTDDAYLLTSSFGYRADEGTIIATAISAAISPSPLVFSLSDGTNLNRIESVARNGSHLFVKVGGSTEVALDAGGWVSGVSTTVALAYKEDDFAVSLDGGAVATDTSGSVPAVDKLRIGVRYDGVDYQLNGYIKKFQYQPIRHENAILESESA